MHTPGPWRINDDGAVVAKVSFNVIVAPEVANIGEPIGVTQVAANARLIAAAPDMHAALTAFVASFTGGDVTRAQPGSLLRSAADLLARIDGKEQRS